MPRILGPSKCLCETVGWNMAHLSSKHAAGQMKHIHRLSQAQHPARDTFKSVCVSFLKFPSPHCPNAVAIASLHGNELGISSDVSNLKIRSLDWHKMKSYYTCDFSDDRKQNGRKRLSNTYVHAHMNLYANSSQWKDMFSDWKIV